MEGVFSDKIAGQLTQFAGNRQASSMDIIEVVDRLLKFTAGGRVDQMHSPRVAWSQSDSHKGDQYIISQFTKILNQYQGSDSGLDAVVKGFAEIDAAFLRRLESSVGLKLSFEANPLKIDLSIFGSRDISDQPQCLVLFRVVKIDLRDFGLIKGLLPPPDRVGAPSESGKNSSKVSVMADAAGSRGFAERRASSSAWWLVALLGVAALSIWAYRRKV